MTASTEQQPTDGSDPEKDAPLLDDIRLLGRLLGDVVQAQDGEAIFDIVESIRQISIRFHRDEDDAAKAELEATLARLDPAPRRSRSFARSAISPTSPTSPRTSIISAARAATTLPARRRARVRWPE